MIRLDMVFRNFCNRGIPVPKQKRLRMISRGVQFNAVPVKGYMLTILKIAENVLLKIITTKPG